MTHSQFASIRWIVGLAFLSLTITSTLPVAQAQTFRVAHTFTGTPDGAQPFQASMLYVKGALYGTTTAGGLYNSGTIFKLDGTGRETVLYNFTGGGDGGVPDTNLLLDTKGNLYGTTNNGGDLSCILALGTGCGVVFKFNAKGLSVLYRFTGRADGAFPQGLAMDSTGNLYGGTYNGGNSNCNCGVVYKIDSNGSTSLLYAFRGGADGGSPNGFVTTDSAGNVYGAALIGGNLADCSGSGCGVVFKVDPNGNETPLYAFKGGADGALPNAGFLMDGKGNLYSTAIAGGDLSCSYAGFAGCGVVYEVSPAGKERVLYTFHGADGAIPNYGLIKDQNGNAYSTTSYGGASGNGTVFELTATGGEKVLYSFTGGPDGGVPYSGVTLDAKGNLYSNAFLGGDVSCNPPSGCGTVFRIVP